MSDLSDQLDEIAARLQEAASAVGGVSHALTLREAKHQLQMEDLVQQNADLVARNDELLARIDELEGPPPPPPPTQPAAVDASVVADTKVRVKVAWNDRPKSPWKAVRGAGDDARHPNGGEWVSPDKQPDGEQVLDNLRVDRDVTVGVQFPDGTRLTKKIRAKVPTTVLQVASLRVGVESDL